jgi:hypothetical protein
MQSLANTGLSPALRAATPTPAARLITPNVALGRIGLLLANEDVDVKQHLLVIAGIALAAVIAIDGDTIEVGKIDGLQECVNRALFITLAEEITWLKSRAL